MLRHRLLSLLSVPLSLSLSQIVQAHPDHDLAAKDIWLEDGITHLFVHSDHLFSLFAIAALVGISIAVKTFKQQRQHGQPQHRYERIQ